MHMEGVKGSNSAVLLQYWRNHCAVISQCKQTRVMLMSTLPLHTLAGLLEILFKKQMCNWLLHWQSSAEEVCAHAVRQIWLHGQQQSQDSW